MYDGARQCYQRKENSQAIRNSLQSVQPVNVTEQRSEESYFWTETFRDVLAICQATDLIDFQESSCRGLVINHYKIISCIVCIGLQGIAYVFMYGRVTVAMGKQLRVIQFHLNTVLASTISNISLLVS